jgi:hypothetical protein
MINLFWPIIIVVAANTLYNISAKLTPSGVHPLASLSITYLLLLYYLYSYTFMLKQRDWLQYYRGTSFRSSLNLHKDILY